MRHRDFRIHRTRRRAQELAISVFFIGAVTRFGPILLSNGGVRGNYGYNASVYYAAADAFIHGRLPYRDFVLLHPPGVMLALAPFASLGNATTDLTGFVAGNLAFALIGAVNGVLAYCVARRLGVSPSAAWLGGAFYALWAGAVFVEMSSQLEPLGSFAFLCGMLAVTGGRPEQGRRNAVLAGVALGFAFCIKIWWIAPLVIVAVWLWRQGGGRRRLRGFLAGAAGVVAIIDGPFFLLAPQGMAQMIVLDQVGRGGGVPLTSRFVTFSTLPTAMPHIRGAASVVVSLGFAAIFAGVCFLAWRLAPARLVVVLAVVHLLILLVAPSFFATYLDFVAPPLALTVAAAAEARIGGRSTRPLLAGVVAGATAITVAATLVNADIGVSPFPTRQLAGHDPHAWCVTSITPAPLIQLDVLSRNLVHGCPQWVDSYGRTYGADKSVSPLRRNDLKWQADLRHYLLSGNAIVLVLPDAALSSRSLRMLLHNPRVTRTDLAHVVDGAHIESVGIYTVAPNGHGRERRREMGSGRV